MVTVQSLPLVRADVEVRDGGVYAVRADLETQRIGTVRGGGIGLWATVPATELHSTREGAIDALVRRWNEENAA